MKKSINKLMISLLLAALFTGAAFSQEDEGMRLYREGKFKKAAESLKKSLKQDDSNAEFWNLLGLSLEKTGDFKEAQVALEKSVSLDADNASFYSNLAFVFLRLNKYDDAKVKASSAISLDERNTNAFYFRSAANYGLDNFDEALKDVSHSISLNEKFGAAYLLESEIKFRLFEEGWAEKTYDGYLETLRESIDRLKKCVEICGGDTSAVTRTLDETVKLFEFFEKKKNGEDGSSEAPDTGVDSKAMKVTQKSVPAYTSSARSKDVEGSVRLAVMFRSDGTIGPVVVLEGIPEGLTKQAVKAAKAIKFKPEMREGKPVTVVKTIVYTFSVY